MFDKFFLALKDINSILGERIEFYNMLAAMKPDIDKYGILEHTHNYDPLLMDWKSAATAVCIMQHYGLYLDEPIGDLIYVVLPGYKFRSRHVTNRSQISGFGKTLQEAVYACMIKAKKIGAI